MWILKKKKPHLDNAQLKFNFEAQSLEVTKVGFWKPGKEICRRQLDRSSQELPDLIFCHLSGKAIILRW